MRVDLFGVVLFLHILVAIVAFAMAGVMHTGLQVLSRGRTVQELRPMARVMHRIEPLFPIAALVLLGLGSWLVHLGAHTGDRFSFKDGWVLTAIIVLVGVEAAGGIVLAPAGKKLSGLVEEAADGPVTDEIRAAATNRMFWHVAHVTTFGFLGVVFLMAAKPTGGWAPVFPIVGALLGMLLAHLQLAGIDRAVTAPAVPGQRAVNERDTATA